MAGTSPAIMTFLVPPREPTTCYQLGGLIRDTNSNLFVSLAENLEIEGTVEVDYAINSVVHLVEEGVAVFKVIVVIGELLDQGTGGRNYYLVKALVVLNIENAVVIEILLIGQGIPLGETQLLGDGRSLCSADGIDGLIPVLSSYLRIPGSHYPILGIGIAVVTPACAIGIVEAIVIRESNRSEGQVSDGIGKNVPDGRTADVEAATEEGSVEHIVPEIVVQAIVADEPVPRREADYPVAKVVWRIAPETAYRGVGHGIAPHGTGSGGSSG